MSYLLLSYCIELRIAEVVVDWVKEVGKVQNVGYHPDSNDNYLQTQPK